MQSKNFTEEQLRWAIDVAKINMRLKEIESYTPLNPLTVTRQIREIEQLTSYKKLIEHNVSDEDNRYGLIYNSSLVEMLSTSLPNLTTEGATMQQTTPHIPEDIQQALNQIYLWVKDGCPEHDLLDTCAGICSNISWVLNYEYDCAEVNEMLFGEDETPFNADGRDYNKELNKFTNPKRLAWLQEHQTVK